MCSNSPSEQLVKEVKGLLEKPETLRGDISSVISLLEKHVGLDDGMISPGPDDAELWKAFVGVVKELSSQKFSLQAITNLTVWLYHHICSLQLKLPERYHKGSFTHQAGIFYLNLGQRYIARWFFTLAFIEDVLQSMEKTDARPVAGPAATTLRLAFNMPPSVLKAIEKKTKGAYKSSNDLWYFPETIAVTLTEQELPLQPPHIGTEEVPLNRPFVQHLCDRLDERGITNDEKGRRLEDFAAYLLQTLPGARVLRNVTTPDSESDLIVVQQSFGNSYMLEALGRAFLVECKNWEKDTTGAVGAKEVNHFVAKMRFHKCKCGVLFAKSGISGTQSKDLVKDARLTLLRWFHQDGCSVLVVEKADFQLLAEGSMSVSEMLLRKHELLRFRNIVKGFEYKKSDT